MTTPANDRFFPGAKKKPIRGGRLAALTEEGDEFNRTKSSSTSTLYINSTVSTPDVDELLRCASIKIHHHIQQGLSQDEKVSFDIFDERINRLDNGTILDEIPSVDDIYQFISIIFDTEQLSAECAIMTLAYIERIIDLTGLTLDIANWRRVVLSTLILASKVWEDQAVWNVDFCSVFPHVTAQDLAQLEKVLLRLLKFNVSLKSSDYTKYYFELRGFAERDSRNFPLKPLDKAAAQKLESRSASEEEKARVQAENLPRSKSLESLKNLLKSPRVVIN